MSISALLIDLQKNWSFFAPPVRNETTVAEKAANTRLWSSVANPLRGGCTLLPLTEA